MTKPQFGTREYYAEAFADYLADAASTEDPIKDYEHAMRILGGFQDAIESWLKYHRCAVDTFESLRDEFLGFSMSSVRATPWRGDLEAEEAALPEIPDIPTLLK